MKNKFYLFLLLFFIGAFRASAQDTTACNAQFYVSYDGNTVFFRAVDSITGVQHQWSFGDTTQSGWGNYVGISHTYSHPGSYNVVHRISNPSTGCHDSSTQVITIAAPPPNCSITFYYSHDSTRAGQPYSFYAQPYLAGAATDTVTWRINDTIAGIGDTLNRVLQRGTYRVCATLVTSAGCRSQYCQTINVGDTSTPPPPPQCSVNVTYSHDSTQPNRPYFFFAQANLAGAARDSITWRINDTIVGTGDTLVHVLHNGNNIVCANLITSLGCQSTSCVGIMVGDTTRATPPPDSTVTPPPSDSTTTPPADSTAQLIRSYPNPAYSSTNLILKLDNPQMIYIRVYNSMGSQVETRTASGFTGTNIMAVPLGSLQAGIYYIEVQFGNVIKRSRIQKL